MIRARARCWTARAARWSGAHASPPRALRENTLPVGLAHGARLLRDVPKGSALTQSDVALARALAVEWGPKGVRVNSIAPGLVRTDFARALWEDPVNLEQRTRDTPLQRIGEPDEIAGAAVFLAARASGFMTGQTIVVDGGVLAGPPLVGEH